ncbi:MAG: histone deacetylase family protein [Acidimicrobiales bacterium]
MTILLGRHDAFAEHETGPSHPERAARLRAVLAGVAGAAVAEGVVPFEPRPAARHELELVHDAHYIDTLQELCSQGGGRLDADTVVGPASYQAALRAAGAGLDAVERLRGGGTGAAFLALRPPGHHALSSRAMGFCLFNSVAVTAAGIAAGGERVLIVDWDAHHGNGTQTIFWESPEVCYVSLHQYPFYPGTGALDEVGAGPGKGTTVNIPLPSGSTGEAYRRAFDEVVTPVADRHRPDWVLISAGFDAHRDDPLTDLGLSAGDFADLTARSARLAPSGRCVAFLEGGYDLGALELSARACVDALGGVIVRPEPVSSARAPDEQAGRVVSAAAQLHLG